MPIDPDILDGLYNNRIIHLNLEGAHDSGNAKKNNDDATASYGFKGDVDKDETNRTVVLDDADWQAFAAALEKNTSLRRLIISGNPISEPTFSRIMTATGKHPSLTHVQAEDCWATGGMTLAEIIEAMEKVFMENPRIIMAEPLMTNKLESFGEHCIQNQERAQALWEKAMCRPDTLTEQDCKEIKERLPTMIELQLGEETEVKALARQVEKLDMALQQRNVFLDLPPDIAAHMNKKDLRDRSYRAAVSNAGGAPSNGVPAPGRAISSNGGPAGVAQQRTQPRRPGEPAR